MTQGNAKDCEERSEEAIPSLKDYFVPLKLKAGLAMTGMVMLFKNPCEIRA
jgi:hypothetical protein